MIFQLKIVENGTTIAKVNEANQRGGVAFVVEDKVYAGLGEKSNGIRNGFYVSSDSLTKWELIPSIPAQLGVISSGVYDEQKKSFFMIDNDGKIWEYNLTTERMDFTLVMDSYEKLSHVHAGWIDLYFRARYLSKE